ncbi:unnamed protein product, partial [Amoebophrya sp. A25]
PSTTTVLASPVTQTESNKGHEDERDMSSSTRPASNFVVGNSCIYNSADFIVGGGPPVAGNTLDRSRMTKCSKVSLFSSTTFNIEQSSPIYHSDHLAEAEQGELEDSAARPEEGGGGRESHFSQGQAAASQTDTTARLVREALASKRQEVENSNEEDFVEVTEETSPGSC